MGILLDRARLRRAGNGAVTSRETGRRAVGSNRYALAEAANSWGGANRMSGRVVRMTGHVVIEVPGVPSSSTTDAYWESDAGLRWPGGGMSAGIRAPDRRGQGMSGGSRLQPVCDRFPLGRARLRRVQVAERRLTGRCARSTRLFDDVTRPDRAARGA